MFALYNRGRKIPVKKMEKNKLRLLVVEDEKKLCDMIVKSLHQAGYEVDTCNDGEEDKREFMTWSFKRLKNL